MRRQHRRIKQPLAPEWNVLPVLDIATLRSLLVSYRQRKCDEGLLGVFLDSAYADAGKELIERCVTFDIGEQLLLSDPVLIRPTIRECVNSQFPIASQVYVEIQACAGNIPAIPQRLYANHNVASSRMPFLHGAGTVFIRPDHGLSRSPKLWDASVWTEYLTKYPFELFRVTTFITAQHVAKVAPAIVTPRIHELFPSFFPKGYYADGGSWDRSHLNTADDDPSESWKR